MHIDIGKDFTFYPFGRHNSDSNYSGQAFRENVLLPNIEKGKEITIELDNVAGYSDAFLEEAFRGLNVMYPDKIKLQSKDQSLISDIEKLLNEV